MRCHRAGSGDRLIGLTGRTAAGHRRPRPQGRRDAAVKEPRPWYVEADDSQATTSGRAALSSKGRRARPRARDFALACRGPIAGAAEPPWRTRRVLVLTSFFFLCSGVRRRSPACAKCSRASAAERREARIRKRRSAAVALEPRDDASAVRLHRRGGARHSGGDVVQSLLGIEAMRIGPGSNPEGAVVCRGISSARLGGDAATSRSSREISARRDLYSTRPSGRGRTMSDDHWEKDNSARGDLAA